MTRAPVVILALLLSAAPAAAEPTMPGCAYEGALSVEHMTRMVSPVLFQWFDCNRPARETVDRLYRPRVVRK